MKLAIITNNDIYKDALLRALSGLDIQLCTYSNIDEVGSLDDVDLAILDVSDDVLGRISEFSKSVQCFGVLNADINIDHNLRSYFLRLFEAPVRLGGIAQSIRLYRQQRQQRTSLEPLQMGKFILNPRTNILDIDGEDRSIRLTEKEQNILIYLNSCRGTSVSRQNLLDHVWGYAQDVETHTLETHIYRLRQKIEIDPTSPQFLMTDDAGYYLQI